MNTIRQYFQIPIVILV